MNTKTIRFDMNQYRLNERLRAKQGDTKSRYLLFELLDGAIPFDLTSKAVKAYMIKPDARLVFNDLVILDADKGVCSLELTNQVLAKDGIVRMELMILQGDKKLTSTVFELEVFASINSDDAIVSTNEFSTLIKALQDAEKFRNELIEASGKLETAYATELNKTKHDIAYSTEIEILADIDGSKYKKGDKVDVSYLQLRQAQLYGKVMWELQNNGYVTIINQGDSLTYGHDISSADRIAPIAPHVFSRASKTYPEALSEFMNEVYPNKVTVINKGYSGDDCERSYNRHSEFMEADLNIIMLGSNDAISSGSDYVGDVVQYMYYYEQLIIRELIWGHAVILMKSPRTLWANDKRIEAFSNAVELLANKYNIPVLDCTPFVSSHNVDIWSDMTEENPNKICKHFTGKGYPLIGAGVASALIGESIVNAKKITSGDTLLCREQVDSVKHVSGCLNLEVNTAYTPQERTDGKSIVCRMGENGKIVYSFYADQEDLVVFPTTYCYANSSFKMTLDFGVEQPYPTLTSKYAGNSYNTKKIANVFSETLTENQLYRKDLFSSANKEPLRITRKGWHTLTIEANNAIFYGLEFMAYTEWEDRKNVLVVKSIGENLLQLKFNDTYYELLGKTNIPLAKEVNKVQIEEIPDNFVVLNRNATISNQDTNSSCAIYIEGDKVCVEVVNRGSQSQSRVAFIDFRLFGYFN